MQLIGKNVLMYNDMKIKLDKNDNGFYLWSKNDLL